MSNAAKHRKKAAEFEQLKQIDRAIASYVKAIEESEAAGEDIDVALLNKVGDLALRQGRVPDAITYYERAVEHYATSGLFNNAIALCNKILRNAPGRANVYFTLGRICARKGLRGDATRNFLEYATRMQQEGRVDEGMRALAEVADLMPELTEVRRMVEEHAQRAGITLPRRKTPARSVAVESDAPPGRELKSADLVFLDIDYGAPASRTPMSAPRIPTPVATTKVPTPAEPVVELPFIIDTPRSPTPRPVKLVTPPPVPVIEPPVIEPPVIELPVIETPPPVRLVTPPPTETIAQATETPPTVEPLLGLEANGEFSGDEVPVLDGFTSDDLPKVESDAAADVVTPLDLTSRGAEADAAGIPILDELLVEDFQGGPTDEAVSQTFGVPATGSEPPPRPVDPTPLVVESVLDVTEPVSGPPGEATYDSLTAGLAAQDAVPLEFPALDIEPVPELDAAIAAGEELVARAEEAARVADAMRAVRPTPRGTPVIELEAIEEFAPPYRPPYRIDPHDFILPGELPPLMLDDGAVALGLEASSDREPDAALTPAPAAPVASTGLDLLFDPELEDKAVEAVVEIEAVSEIDVVAVELSDVPLSETEALVVDVSTIDVSSIDVADEATDDTIETETEAPQYEPAEAEPAEAEPAEAEAAADDDTEPAYEGRPVSVTPALPIAAVAAEAQQVATARRDSLRAAVARMPQNWLLRRRLAEALFEAGERDAALAELETAQSGLQAAGEFESAAEIADELVQVSPDRVPYHQRRVELAVQTNSETRLRSAYLDLADALVRMGEEGRARAVYARVLEIDPHDDRARTALGAAAPPPPAPAPSVPDDNFVDLADWLRDDDEPASTRMRMREPTITGDEQADFDSLLRHFKEGVARSLGEDDFESHYDLGVAYKEMGLLEDAIAEFQKALRSRSHRLPAYEALGQCFVEQGRHQVAATILSRALHEPGLNDDQRVGVLYLLAYACEALQRWDEARSYYQRVYATDIQFRDVTARLAAVEQASR
jgi:tetratricopeptide (TPR) repeat protein